MTRFAGKVVLISGAARGQGAEEARRFADEGATVVLGDVLDAEGEATAKEIGDAATFVHLDVTDESSWEAAVGVHGRLDVLVNNAGILGPFTPIGEMGVEDFRRTIDVNLVGTFLGCKVGGEAIAAAGGGAIVNISSISGMWGTPFQAAYVASKWAIRGLTKTASLELGRKNIRVNSVHPGGVETPMHPDMGPDGGAGWYGRIPIPRIGKVDDVAAAVLFLASDEAAYITGAELVVDGGSIAGDVALLPRAR